MEKADWVTPYAFFILPRSDKPIVMQINVQNLEARAQHGPPVWKEYFRLPVVENQE